MIRNSTVTALTIELLYDGPSIHVRRTATRAHLSVFCDHILSFYGDACAGPPIPGLTLNSAGPIVDFTLSPPSAGAVLLLTTLSVTLAPVDGTSDVDIGTASGSEAVFAADFADAGRFTVDLLDPTRFPSLESGDQIVAVLFFDFIAAEFTPAGDGFIAVNAPEASDVLNPGITASFTNTLAAFSFDGAP